MSVSPVRDIGVSNAEDKDDAGGDDSSEDARQAECLWCVECAWGSEFKGVFFLVEQVFLFLLHLSLLATVTSFCRVTYSCHAGRWGVPLGDSAPVKVLTKASKERPTRGQTSRKKKKNEEREKKYPSVLRLLHEWLKKRGSVHPHMLFHVMSWLEVLLLAPCLGPRALRMPKRVCRQPGHRRNDRGG